MKKLSDFSDNFQKKDRKSAFKRGMSPVLTLIVISMFVFAGPVDALHLGIEGLKNTPYSFGEIVSFSGKVDINNNEIVDIDRISIEVNSQTVCTFQNNGTIISGCDGMSISLLNLPSYGYGQGFTNFELGWNGGNNSVNAGTYNGINYGYGYGYSNGQIKYNISIQSPQNYLNTPGNNQLKLVVYTSDQTFNSRTESFVIQPQNANNANSNSGNSNSVRRNEERRNNRVIVPLTNTVNLTNEVVNLTTTNSDPNDPRTNDDAFEKLKEEVIKEANINQPTKNLELIRGKFVDKSMTFLDYFYLGIVLFLTLVVVFGFWFHKKRSNRFINRYLGYY